MKNGSFHNVYEPSSLCPCIRSYFGQIDYYIKVSKISKVNWDMCEVNGKSYNGGGWGGDG